MKEGEYSEISETQIQHMAMWIEEYIKSHRQILIKSGLAPQSIYDEYKATTSWPAGRKNFFPMFHLFGPEKVRKGNGFVYVLWES